MTELCPSHRVSVTVPKAQQEAPGSIIREDSQASNVSFTSGKWLKGEVSAGEAARGAGMKEWGIARSCPGARPGEKWTCCRSFLCSAGSQDLIAGASNVSGMEKGTLTMQCHYTPKWKTYKKYWCQGAKYSNCQVRVKTSGSEQEVKEDRLSIRDSHRELMFTVTMKDLEKNDADIYWCGIERAGYDLKDQVTVTIDSVLFTTEETNSLSTLTRYHSSGRHRITELSTLLPLSLAVLVLLLVAATILAWWMMRQQKKAAVLSREQPLEGDLCYANLSLQQPRTCSGSSRKKASTEPSSVPGGEEVDYVTMAPFPREDVSYVSLCVHTLDQEPTYSNTSPVPSRAHEELTEYSRIKRP
ncbi:CMRF35-like molecule 1 [Ctenodactylus gundi]